MPADSKTKSDYNLDKWFELVADRLELERKPSHDATSSSTSSLNYQVRLGINDRSLLDNTYKKFKKKWTLRC
jgi:hypothetical protein